MSKKIFIFVISKGELGHVSTISKIVEFIQKKDKLINFFVFHCGPLPPKSLIPENIVWHNISFDTLSNPYDLLNILLYHLRKYNPCIFISEYFPFGRLEFKSILLPVINWLKKNKILITASIPHPYFSYRCFLSPGKLNEVANLCRLYDKLWIHTPSDTEDIYMLKNVARIVTKSSEKIYKNFFERFKDKITYTGYLVSSQSFYKKNFPQIQKGKINVAVSRGGGTMGFKIITSAISAIRYLDEKFYFIIALGHNTKKEEKQIIIDLLKKNDQQRIHIQNFFVNFPSLLSCCDISVSPAAYNISADIFYLKKKAILIPTLDNGIEQISRAQMMRDFLEIKVMNYKNLNSRILAEEIRNLSYSKNDHIPKINDDFFLGLEKVYKELYSYLR